MLRGDELFSRQLEPHFIARILFAGGSVFALRSYVGHSKLLALYFEACLIKHSIEEKLANVSINRQIEQTQKNN